MIALLIPSGANNPPHPAKAYLTCNVRPYLWCIMNVVDVSPFPFQGPLEPAEVTGRDELVADLVRRVTTRRVAALLAVITPAR
jgi:hypothetical protein